MESYDVVEAILGPLEYSTVVFHIDLQYSPTVLSAITKYILILFSSYILCNEQEAISSKTSVFPF